jgi:hypothetical protein
LSTLACTAFCNIVSQAKSEGDELMNLGGHGMRLRVSINKPEKSACGTPFTNTNNDRIANSEQYCG